VCVYHTAGDTQPTPHRSLPPSFPAGLPARHKTACLRWCIYAYACQGQGPVRGGVRFLSSQLSWLLGTGFRRSVAACSAPCNTSILPGAGAYGQPALLDTLPLAAATAGGGHLLTSSSRSRSSSSSSSSSRRRRRRRRPRRRQRRSYGVLAWSMPPPPGLSCRGPGISLQQLLWIDCGSTVIPPCVNAQQAAGAAAGTAHVSQIVSTVLC
jgi:hypothetical protein